MTWTVAILSLATVETATHVQTLKFRYGKSKSWTGNPAICMTFIDVGVILYISVNKYMYIYIN